jgi:hypothetical protein
MSAIVLTRDGARVLQAAMSNSPFLVTAGLDPVVHAKLRLTEAQRKLRRRMDCRIKSGNDEVRTNERK